jgi:Rps23 Pro-64 3,4-dihydroxylase Tpa1-like proline 4-hydroxylase
MALKKYIKIYDNVIPLDTVGSLTKFISNLDFKTAKVGLGQEETDIRNVLDRSLTNSCKNMTEIKWFNFIKHVFTQYTQKYVFNVVKQESHSINPGQILEINALKYKTGGHYIYHVDYFEAHPRQFSLILLLNNDYEGGELVFNDPSYQNEYIIPVRPGRLLVWPSNFLFPHKVNKVTKGTRYSIVGWSH